MKKAKPIMVQGTMSSAGKSLLCAAPFYTNIQLKEDTERRGYFVPDEEGGAGNTVCIFKPTDEVWRKKDRHECLVLIGH